MVSKVFGKLVDNRIVDYLEKCGLFSDSQYGFWSIKCTSSDGINRIARSLNRAGATRVVALDISKAFDSVWCAGLLHKLKSYGISVQIFDFISSFISNRWLWVVQDRKISQEYLVNEGVPQGAILGNYLPDDVICSIAIYADDTALYSKYDLASDLWQP